MTMSYEYTNKPDFQNVRLSETEKVSTDENLSSVFNNNKQMHEPGHNKNISDEHFKNTSTHHNMKPSDVKNCDLVSLLLAATPPYLYNIPLVPQTFFFSEMLRSFVQAKADRQSLKAQQIHHRRTRKRTWREVSPPKINNNYEVHDKPLELTTPRANEDKSKPQQEKVEPVEKKQTSTNFTAEKLANSSINEVCNNTEQNNETVPPPLWYPSLYPSTAPYGIDPLHFFIDLRVSAHIWDRKIAAEKDSLPPIAPLNLTEKQMPILEPSLNKNRHNSAFSVPVPRTDEDAAKPAGKGTKNMHYILHNLKEIYKLEKKKKEEEEQKEDEKEEESNDVEGESKKKKCKDLRALIGLELVVDYVKQDSDVSDDEDETGNDVTDKQESA